MARALYAESLFDGKQWLSDVSLEFDSRGQITAIQSGRLPDAEVVRGPVIPGMINCHSHAFQRAFAGLTEVSAGGKDSFWSWRELMYRLLSSLSPDDVNKIACQLYIEMLKAGYTSVAEFHYLHHDSNGQAYSDVALMSKAVIEAAIDVGLGITHLPVLYTYGGFGEQAPSPRQGRFINDVSTFADIVSELDKTYQTTDNVKTGIAAHSLRAVSESQLETLLLQFPATQERPFHIHIAEQLLEVEECRQYYGQTPVRWLLERFALNQYCCLIHATHLDNAEIELMVQDQVVAGLCPTTEANLGDGIFPSDSYLGKKGRIAIGSDSHIAVNVADELRTLEYGQRLIRHQRAVLHSSENPHVGRRLFSASLAGGRNSVGQNCGLLAVGKQADLVVLDAAHPALIGKQQDYLLDAAIFAAPQIPVHSVMVAGHWQVKAGHHDKEERVLSDFAQVMQKVMQLCN